MAKGAKGGSSYPRVKGNGPYANKVAARMYPHYEKAMENRGSKSWRNPTPKDIQAEKGMGIAEKTARRDKLGIAYDW